MKRLVQITKFIEQEGNAPHVAYSLFAGYTRKNGKVGDKVSYSGKLSFLETRKFEIAEVILVDNLQYHLKVINDAI